MRVVRGVVAVSLALLAGCGRAAAPAAHSAVGGGRLPTDAFVAEYAYGAGDTGGGHGTFLSVFNEQSGTRVRDLVRVEEHSPVQLAGYSRGSDGSVTYALARGPHYRSSVNGGDPEPGSCGGTVYRVDARTGDAQSLFTVPARRTVGWPVASPDGRSVAYLSQPCTSEFAQRVVVHDLATGGERSVYVAGSDAVSMAWRSDGSQIVFTVMFANPRSGADHPGFVVVPAQALGAQGLSVVHRAPDLGCVVEQATFESAGILVAEGCPDTVTAPARLVQLAAGGPRVSWRASTTLCPNGMTLAHDMSGRLLVTATTTCGGAGAPVDVVQLWSGRQRHEVARYVNPQQFVDGAA